MNRFEQFVITRVIVTFAKRLEKGARKMDFLNGYKSYIAAAALVLVAALETFLGVDVPNFDMAFGTAVNVALGMIFLRTGSKTDAAKVEKKIDTNL
jgi:hypothetical protein